jgi:hypothetical protein
MRPNPISPDVMADLRVMIEELVADAIERALAQAGEISFAKIGNAQGEIEVADDKRDAWTHTTDVATEHKRMPRIYTPASILFNQPAKGDTVHVLRAKDCGGPGAELAIPDGGDGSANHLPDWYSDPKAGISVDGKVAVLESRTDDVDVRSGSGKIVNVQDGNKGIARLDDDVDLGVWTATATATGLTAIAITLPSGQVVNLNLAQTGVPQAMTGRIKTASTKAKCG